MIASGSHPLHFKPVARSSQVARRADIVPASQSFGLMKKPPSKAKDSATENQFKIDVFRGWQMKRQPQQ